MFSLSCQTRLFALDPIVVQLLFSSRPKADTKYQNAPASLPKAAKKYQNITFNNLYSTASQESMQTTYMQHSMNIREHRMQSVVRFSAPHGPPYARRKYHETR